MSEVVLVIFSTLLIRTELILRVCLDSLVDTLE